MSALAVSSGKPCIDPDTSSRKMYSRGGICAAVGRCGGSIMSAKYPSPSARRGAEQQAGLDLVVGQPVAQHEVAVAARSLIAAA